MQKIKLWRIGGALIFLVATAPVFAQVTTLDSNDVPNSSTAPTASPTVEAPNGPTVGTSPNSQNSLIVTGPADKIDVVPSIDLDKFLQENAPNRSTDANDAVANKR